MDQNLKYTEAFTELQQIVDEIEQGQITIDELSEKVKRAATLLKICQMKLSSTEADVSKILEDINKQEDAF